MEAALTTDRYEQQRTAVHAHLRRSFGQLFDEGDRDDLLHDAWTAVVIKHEAGERIDNETALLKTIAYRRGRDRLRGAHSDPCDPLEGTLTLVPDVGPAAEERVEVQLEADLCREVIATLKERQQKLLKLRLEWGLPAAEVQRLLGMTQRTYERQMTKALKRVAQIVGEIEDGTWSQKQLDLLIAVESGTASAEERADARRLVERNPHCRALLGRLRGAAAVLPLPFAAPSGPANVVAHLTSFFGTCKQHATGAVIRLQTGGDSVTPLATTGGTKGAGGVISAKVATIIIAGTAATGGGAAVGTGAIDLPGTTSNSVPAQTAVAKPKPLAQVAGVSATSSDATERAERRAARRAAARRAAKRRARARAKPKAQPVARPQQPQPSTQPSTSAPQGEFATESNAPSGQASAGATTKPNPTRPSTPTPAAPAEDGGEFGP